MSRSRGALVVAAALLLAGCAATPPPPAEAPDAAALAARVAARDAELRAFERFRVRGGLGVWNEETSLTARIDWRQAGEALELGLRGPLGLGSARLTDGPDGAAFRRGEAPPVRGASAGEVLQRALGLAAPVPIEQLASWLRGLPGEAEEVRRDAEGRLETLRWTDGSGTRWRARVRRYTTLGELELPTLLTARGGGQHLRLALRDWSADPDGAAGAAPGATESTPTAPRLPIPTR